MSNFWNCPLTLDDIVYPTAEHAYMAQKAKTKEERLYISTISTAKEARYYGKSMELVDNWDAKRLKSMAKVLLAKFENEGLKDKLLATKHLYLEETNTWGDTFWGVCNGVGENNLGKLLMNTRDYYLGVI